MSTDQQGPVCVVHGPMRFSFEGDWWKCHGWDGEGCSAIPMEVFQHDSQRFLRVRPWGMVSSSGFRAAVPA